MLSRLKSSLEKRAPSVVGALRNLRGQEAPVAPTPVARPAPVTPLATVAPTPVARPVVAPVVPAPIVAAPAAPVVVAAPVAPEPAPAAVVAATAPATPVVAPAPIPVAAPPAPKPVAHAAPPAVAKPAEKQKHQAADTGSTDVGAYLARAKANGRDPGLITGTEGINVAADGVTFDGPLDNESSRAKAAKKLLTIDQFECISCGTCVEQTEKVFYLPADGKATPIAQEGPMDLIQDAIEACPVTCIHWVTPDEAVERNLTSGVEA